MRLRNEVQVIMVDHPDGEAEDWVNGEDIGMHQRQNLPPESVTRCDQLEVFF